MKRLKPSSAISGALFACAFGLAAPAAAAPVVTTVDLDYYDAPYSFMFGDSSFTLQYSGDIFGPTSISTGGTGEVNTIFGSPTTNFPDRGTVTFGSGMQYGSFPRPTEISYSNGGNLIGLSATKGGNTYYGFVYTTDAHINSYGFESVAGATIDASAAIVPTAVPEPASWALMIGGIGFAGGMIRGRLRRSETAFAARVRLAASLA